MVPPLTVIEESQMEESLPRLDLARRLNATVDFAASSHKRAIFMLILFALLCFLQGIRTLPPTNRDESRYAQATKQMFESNDFVDIRFQDQPRYRKPIGIYWLQAASVGLAKSAGISDAQQRIFFYRIPSLLNATASVLVLYWAALAFVRGVMHSWPRSLSRDRSFWAWRRGSRPSTLRYC